MQLNGQNGQERAARMDALLIEVEAIPDPAIRATAVETIQAVVGFYGEGLARAVETISSEHPALLATLAEDELFSHLLLLHDLHPLPVADRVAKALEEVGPYVQSQGGEVQLTGIFDNRAVIRIGGGCQGCSSSTATVAVAVEDAILSHAPELDGVTNESADLTAASANGFIPLTSIGRPKIVPANAVKEPVPVA